jgi:hypothetical protein
VLKGRDIREFVPSSAFANLVSTNLSTQKKKPINDSPPVTTTESKQQILDRHNFYMFKFRSVLPSFFVFLSVFAS